MTETRGRSASRGRFGGRRASRGRGEPVNRGKPRRDFFDDDVADAVAAQNQIKKEQIENKKKEDVKPVDNSKKEDLINKGKQWFNKFFAGIKKKDRANVNVELNSNLDLELYASYDQKIHNMISNSYYYSEKYWKQAPSFLRPYINILIGIKLIKASTSENKGLMRNYQPLTQMDLKVPKNMGVLLDCIGKTDAVNDNVVRVIGQNSMIKSCFLKACIDACSIDERMVFDNMLWNSNVSYDDIERFRRNHILKKSDLRIYSADRSGIQIINEYGKKGIEFLNRMDITIRLPGISSDYYVRLPYLDPKHNGNIVKILEWETKVSGFFTAIKFDPTEYTKSIGLALLGWLPLRFLVARDKSFAELDRRFEGTVFARLKPVEVLANDSWYCVDDWVNDNQLYDNIVYLIELYKSKFEKIYDDCFHMVKFQPSEFGNSAQLVLGQDKEEVWLENTEYESKVEVVKNNKPTITYLKMSDEEAILGSVFKFNEHVRFKTGYDIHMTGGSREIRNSFIFHDYK